MTTPSSYAFFMLLTCWKQQRHLPLPHLQMCFSPSSSEEQTREVYRGVTPGLRLGEYDVRDEFCNLNDPGSPTNLLVARDGANPHQMLCPRHRYILGCTWSSEPAKLSMLRMMHAHASLGPAAEPACAPWLHLKGGKKCA